MRNYKKSIVYGVAINLLFASLNGVQEAKAVCQDYTCGLSFHTFNDCCLLSSDGARRGTKKVFVSGNFSGNAKQSITLGYGKWNKYSSYVKLIAVTSNSNAQISFNSNTLDKNVFGVTSLFKKGETRIENPYNLSTNYVKAKIEIDEDQCTTPNNLLLEVASHEAGHALGLSHVTCRNSVMYPRAGTNFSTSKPTEEDLNTLLHIYK